MAYSEELAHRVRKYLDKKKVANVEEKKMFGGLAFLINEKMCVNVSGGGLMCRYHPDLQAEVEQKTGYEKMVMRGREMDGYGYVNEAGITGEKNFSYWMKLCLDYNPLAAKSKKQTSTKRQSNKI